MRFAHPFVVACLACGAGRADPPAVVKAEPLPAWDAKFRRTDGWIGGDGAYSVSISPTRTLWLFSDTWVGAVRGGKRTGLTMVNNTVGIQDGHGKDAKVSFVVRRGKDGKPTALFTPADGRGWFWPLAAAYHGGKLYLFLAQMEKTKAGGAFGFRGIGRWLGVVSNPADDPTAWKMTQHKLPWAESAADRKLEFGSAVLTVGEHLYVYGFEERPRKGWFPKRQMVLARVPIVTVDDFKSWRFLTADGWKAEPTDLKPLADGLATEYSVSYLPGLKRYAAVYTELGLSDRIVARFAALPEGPWSEAVLLYKCPEMKRDKRVFSYAAKAHPHLATGNELVISYVVNSFELGPVVNDATLYWPTFVRVTLR
ncbi:MAG TPA: DUF4185 domain-containing protein [Fimbriiglobus sp.]|nr:DUF4185 domain-containing protein [Fimbriiglobus sp.]